MTKPHRIGLLVPSTNTTVEADFQRLLPDTVTAHSERLFIPDGEMTEHSLDMMNRNLPEKVALLASAHVDVIVYACTSGSFYRGPGWDREVTETVESVASVPCVATSIAVTDALRALGAQHLSVATPYPHWTNGRLCEYYRMQGFSIASIDGDSRSATEGHRAVNDQEPYEIAAFTLEHVQQHADTIFCSCTAWRAAECISELERRTGRPVVTSNQAVLWSALRTLKVHHPIPTSGMLFAQA